MSYKKFLKNVTLPKAKMGVSGNGPDGNASLYNKYKNYLPIVYQGPNNRLERYTIYDGMEQDPTISWSLDIVTDFVIQSEEEEPFKINYEMNQELPDSQTETIEKALDEWIKLNSWRKRLFPTVRDVLKFGDVVFVRDPETLEVNKCNIYDVLGVVVDIVKNPTHYVIKNVELNCPLNVATTAENDTITKNLLNTINSNFPSITNNSSTQSVGNPTENNTTLPVKAENIIHISLNVDNVLLYPFGLSTLENIYKSYIQKMLLQDSVLLYRIKNAVEKMVFKIPVGGIPRHRRRGFLERARNEYTQRRMPSKDSDGVFNTIDVAYNSIPMSEDFWLPVDENGSGPTVDRLPAGQNLGEINDLVYWENVLIRGLKVPQSWVPYGPKDGDRVLPQNSSSVFVQELRFLQYCKRLQSILIEKFDEEFKYYLRQKGLNVDENSFKLSFFPPTNITDLTMMEIEDKRMSSFISAISSEYISKQFAMKKYLKMSEEEFNENQRLLIIEKQNTFKNKDMKLPTEDSSQIPGLRTVGVDDIPMDYMDNLQNMSQSAGMPPMGADMGAGGADMGAGGADMGAMGGDMGAMGGDMGAMGGM